MIKPLSSDTSSGITTLDELSNLADYSFLETLNCDPDADENGAEQAPRQVFTGHYVPVTPTPIQDPEYVAHSTSFFRELGFADNLAQSAEFMQMFSGDMAQVPAPMRNTGWATGYALSIYGTEYYQQCPFGTGNGYGDGRALSVLEAVLNGQRWEMQLKVRVAHLIAVGQTGVRFCVPVSGSFWHRSICRHWVFLRPVH
ncbi:hypothetical protein [Aliamphritea spongicola]|nr:hypothetical protein [Aliamphritea spongicola]